MRKPLGPTEIVRRLSALEGWTLSGDGEGVAIEKTYRFANYHETMAFVNAVAFIAHGEDHHPDLSVHYSRCVVRYSTHDAKGITERDFHCAARVDALLAK
jgi:4a-hydroxytetrahydrobiopterin dehydratase